jgi:hypothetical protein
MQLEDMIKKDKSFNWSDDELGDNDKNSANSAADGAGCSTESEVVSSLKSRV